VPKAILDSYTKETIALSYVSPFKGINNPRTLYKPDGCPVSAQYSVAKREDGLFTVRREGASANFLPPVAEAYTRKLLDWLVTNDGSVTIAIHWINLNEFDPYFNLLAKVQEALYAQPISTPES
jgi:hypothetical protein